VGSVCVMSRISLPDCPGKWATRISQSSSGVFSSSALWMDDFGNLTTGRATEPVPARATRFRRGCPSGSVDVLLTGF